MRHVTATERLRLMSRQQPRVKQVAYNELKASATLAPDDRTSGCVANLYGLSWTRDMRCKPPHKEVRLLPRSW